MSETDDRSGFVPPFDDDSSLSLVAEPSILAEATTISPPEDSMHMESGINDTPQLVENKGCNIIVLHHRISPYGDPFLLTPDTLPSYEEAFKQTVADGTPRFARSLISFSQRLIHPVFSRVAY